MLATAMANGERVLAGFDFPFGYPAGFAARLGLPGPPWRAVWDEIAALLRDNDRNRNNRFEVAADFNRRVSGGPFPFWGCPIGPTRPFLGPKHHRRHDRDTLAERRLIDRFMTGAQPCWKLLGIGSVGGQALTGIPVVRALRDDPRWREAARIWPFETGLADPVGVRLVFSEVYPSWWPISPAPGEPKDAAQVREIARLFAAHGESGELAALFAGPHGLSDAQRQVIENEEAWTLGVMAPRSRSRLAIDAGNAAA
ncbi:MAG: cobalamin biosynthesis protein CbiG [Alphaproteobacteria bacterium]|nr:cobalamin biosynthesis protein CbiG [Alphaproteobacteria bacterium]